MTDLILENATLVNLHPPRVEDGEVHVRDGKIAYVGPSISNADAARDADRIDVDGDIVMPGLVNGHTHLYSALATGMPAPRRSPRNFQEILIEIWWWMDRALTADSIRACGWAGSLDALRSGATTLIDHHASPNAIEGSLDILSDAVAQVGPRAVYCYEITDRQGAEGAEAGRRENARFLEKCAAATNGPTGNKHGAMIGLHAAFTCGPDIMSAAAELADRFGAATHIHVAEDQADRRVTRERFNVDLVDFLLDYKIAREGTIIGHGTHLEPEEFTVLADAGCWFSHQSRSNMNNQVGHVRLGSIPHERFLLGTDGIGADMFAEGQAAFFKSRDGRTGLSPEGVLQALGNNAKRAGMALGLPKLGQLETGGPADLVRLDYQPATPLDAGSLAWHFVFQMGSRFVRDVWIGGEQVLAGRRPLALDSGVVSLDEIRHAAEALWGKMCELD